MRVRDADEGEAVAVEESVQQKPYIGGSHGVVVTVGLYVGSLRSGQAHAHLPEFSHAQWGGGTNRRDAAC